MNKRKDSVSLHGQDNDSDLRNTAPSERIGMMWQVALVRGFFRCFRMMARQRPLIQAFMDRKPAATSAWRKEFIKKTSVIRYSRAAFQKEAQDIMHQFSDQGIL